MSVKKVRQKLGRSLRGLKADASRALGRDMHPIFDRKYTAETPWPLPSKEECEFYHTISYPDGETIRGIWTIPDLKHYIGGFDLAGKTVLDIGTASGYLAFTAEREGAASVTAVDLVDPSEVRYVPYANTPAFDDWPAWAAGLSDHYVRMKKSWWYSWHRHGSKIDLFYRPQDSLWTWDRRFDVVMAGAIVEHLSDPVFSIGAWARLAKEAVLIPFTTVADTEELRMNPITPWNNTANAYAWWELSRGLYRRIFDNLGFDVEFVTAHAQLFNEEGVLTTNAERPSIIARRRP
jgi:SAM-dependent methyltransferase